MPCCLIQVVRHNTIGTKRLLYIWRRKIIPTGFNFLDTNSLAWMPLTALPKFNSTCSNAPCRIANGEIRGE